MSSATGGYSGEQTTGVAAGSLDRLLADAPVLLLVVDAGGAILIATGCHLEQALGEGPGLTGRRLADLPRAATIVKDLVERALGGAAGVGRLALGSEVLQLQVSPVKGASGPVTAVIAVGVREVLQASNDEAFMRLFQASPIPIAISSLEGGVFSHCNDAFVRTFRYPREEVVGRGSVELGMWSPEQRNRAIGELRAKGILAAHESGVKTKDGEVRDMVFNMEPIQFEGRTHLVGFFYDISERKRAEEEQRRLYEQLKQLDQLKGQLVANVSHELRTPLTLVLGLTERLMQGDGLSPGQARDLEAVQRNARGLLKQVNDLLDVARLDAGQAQARYSRCDVAHALRVIASPFDVVASERSVDYVVHAPDVLVAEVDVDKLERIVVNLLSNAFKYAPPGGLVRCSLLAEGDRLLLRVSDNGPGIAPEHRARVFERFFQIEGGATRRHGGTGLGLAIVRELSLVQHGSVRADEGPDGGALVEVDLPLHAPPDARVEGSVDAPDGASARVAVAELRPTEVAEEPTPDPLDRRPKVLIVEDNGEMRHFIAESLGAGYQIVSAEDGEQGLAMAETHRPDLIVTDVMMPRMSGDELVVALRARPSFATTRILLLSAKTDEALRVRLLREGAHDFVTKPFSVDELRARVANQIEMKRINDELALEVAHKAAESLALAERLRHAQKMEAIGKLAGGVAHDFNNVLTVIGGCASLLVAKGQPGTLPTDLAIEIRNASERAAELTRQLLAFSRQQMLHLQILDPNTVVHSLDRMLRRLIGEDVTLVANLAPGLGCIRADAGQLDQVLVNLVVNARDAMPRGGRLTLETGEVVLGEAYARAQPDVVSSGIYVVFSVSDTGAGMPPEVSRRVFDPFFTTKDVGKGTGLGLATAYGIVKQSGGHITVHSEEGVGTVFKVYLPRLDPTERTSPAHEVHPTITGGDETVLLVEDDTAVRTFARRALESIGYRVREADGGHSALASADGAAVDLLLTDVVMPEISGRDLARRVTERWPTTRVLYMSGYTDDAVLRSGVAQGASFLQKPFTASELAIAVRRALGD